MTVTALSHEMRQDVSDVLVRYAIAIDSRDWTLLRTCFTDDCEVDYGEIGVWHDVDSVAAFMEAVHDPVGPSVHRITNQHIAPNADGATARSYVDAIVMAPDGRKGVQAVGYYDDELVHVDAGWKIARRRFTTVVMRPVLAAGE